MQKIFLVKLTLFCGGHLMNLFYQIVSRWTCRLDYKVIFIVLNGFVYFCPDKRVARSVTNSSTYNVLVDQNHLRSFIAFQNLPSFNI